jgi:hypothetical protein
LKGNGGPVITVEDDTGSRDFFAASNISNNGAIAFTASRDSGGFGAYLHNGGITSLVAERGTTGISSAYLSVSAIDSNDSGRVAMFATSPGSPGAVYVGNGGPATLVTERTFHSGGPSTPYLGYPSLNDAGDIVYVATPTSGTMTVYGIYKYSGGVTTPLIALALGNGIASTTAVEINNEGTIAYGETSRIRIGSGSTYSTLISIGDSLFGSTVTSLGPFSLNDRGDVAFSYMLSNNRHGVALAIAVPEPGPLIFAAVIALAVFAVNPLSRSRLRTGAQYGNSS